MIGRVETASVGAGCATVPGALQETVTSLAGSLPQVSRSCSGAVVVGSGSVVVGGPLGAVAASARGAADDRPGEHGRGADADGPDDEPAPREPGLSW